MLCHTLADEGSGAYQEELVFEAEDLRLDLFERAWRGLVSRHAVLRTAVVWEGLPEPGQGVGWEESLVRAAGTGLGGGRRRGGGGVRPRALGGRGTGVARGGGRCRWGGTAVRSRWCSA